MEIPNHIKNSKIFVTGADGFIGSHLVEKLVEIGASVKALCQYNSFGNIGNLADLKSEFLSNVEIVFGDVRDRSLLASQMKDCNYVFHLASLISIPHSYTAAESYVQTNICGLINILEILKNRPFTRLVNTSTSEVYGTAITRPINENHPLQGQSPYAASKIAADHFIEAFHRSFDMPIVTLRPFNTFGPRQSTRAVIPTIIKQLIDPNTEVLKLGDLSPIRDFNYVENTVEAFIHLMFADGINYGEAYNAGSGSTITIGDTVKLIEKNVGIKKQIISDERKSRPSKSEVFELIADYSKFNEATGWEPKITFEQGITRTIEWYLRAGTQKDPKTENPAFD